jgi:hypothetical protein
MPAISIVKKLGIVTSGRRLCHLILAYVDEAAKFNDEGRSASQVKAVADLPSNKRYQICGFLRKEIDTFKQHSPRSRTELEHCAAWWLWKTSRLKRKAQHLTLAFPPSFARQLEEAGFAPGDILFDVINRTFSAFRDQFFSDDDIGFICGLHREKEHPHGHVLFFPQTKTGRPINLSRLAPVRVNGEMKRIDFQGFIQLKFAENVQHWHEMLRAAEHAREAPLWQEPTLFEMEAGSLIQAAAQAGAPPPSQDVIQEKLRDQDFAAAAAASRAERLKAEKTKVLDKPGGFEAVAGKLRTNAEQLSTESQNAKAEDIPGLQARTLRLAGRLLEISRAAQGISPAIQTVVSTPASYAQAERLRLTTKALNRHLDSQRRRQGVVPFHALYNRELTPSEQAATLPAPDVNEEVVLNAVGPRPERMQLQSIDLVARGESFDVVLRELEEASAAPKGPPDLAH